MKFHHYLEVNKFRGKFTLPVKNKGQIRSSIWGVGLNSGFWPEYVPLLKRAEEDVKITAVRCR